MRESDKLSKLGMITSFAGFTVLAISGFLNLNNLNKKGTPEYSIQYRDKTFYSMAGASALMLSGMALLTYPSKRRTNKEKI